MKKLYALLLALLTCSIASAQITITVDGNPLKDGDTYTRLFTEETTIVKVPGVPALDDYGLYPEITITSSKAQDLVITLLDESHDGGVNFCLGTCEIPNEANGYNVTKVAGFEADKSTSAEIHVQHRDAATGPYEVRFQLVAYGTLDQKRATATIILQYDPNAVNALHPLLSSTPSTTSAPYYTLGGQRVAAPGKGIYIRNGKKVIVK